MSDPKLGLTPNTPIATQVPGGQPATLEQLAAQIASLQTEVAALQTQLTAMQGQVGTMERGVSSIADLSQSLGGLQQAFTGHTHGLNPEITLSYVTVTEPGGAVAFGSAPLAIALPGGANSTPVLSWNAAGADAAHLATTGPIAATIF